MPGLSFEWSIKVGDILTLIGALIVAISIVIRRIRAETKSNLILERLVIDFNEMRDEFKAFNTTIRDVASQKVQIEFLLKAYDELRHGDGYVEHDGKHSHKA